MPASRWLMDGTLDTVLEINQQCLESLAPEQAPFGLIEVGRSRTKILSPESRARLAASPYLLADANFGDERHWRALTSQMECDPATQLERPRFTGPGSSDFIRRVLTFGWHMARAQPRHARVVLGMTPACADIVARIRLMDLDWLAQHRPGCVHLRWEQQPHLWRHLLRDSSLPDCESLTHAGMRGLQLMAGSTLGGRHGHGQ
jgi:hypothetical protein